MPTYTASNWNWVSETLTDPVTAVIYTASPWAYVSDTLSDPATPGGTNIPSNWSYISVTLFKPHKPNAVKKAAGFKATKIRSFDGSVWR